MKDKLDLEVERSMNDFLMLSPEEFVKAYTPKQFKRLISLIPPTYQFLQMQVSLMFDLEDLENYEYCVVLRDNLKTHLE